MKFRDLLDRDLPGNDPTRVKRYTPPALPRIRLSKHRRGDLLMTGPRPAAVKARRRAANKAARASRKRNR